MSKKMKTINVNDCNDCPFSVEADQYVYTRCYHFDTPMNDSIMEENDSIKLIHPSWCPLKKESITIELNK